MAMFFDDFKVGDKFTSPARTVTETDIVMFAGLSGDYNPLHTDSEFCKKTIFGEKIAHGLLGLSILTGLSTRLGIFDGSAIAFLGINDWKFKKPILVNDTIHFEMEVIEKRETSKDDRGIIFREFKLINQKDEVVQSGVLPIMVVRRKEHAVVNEK
ncbi:MaoC family dehydratase [Oceanobacillus damuensis]|uniref:MaoC family dehydratase n=1 Tax=Oceanobacillus damuensis TaxID=937928 RepID=UPI00082C5BBF|nr:MaoC/PaaZ C-terminal domain-containing protein [Oceanobacillus damuensis]